MIADRTPADRGGRWSVILWTLVAAWLACFTAAQIVPSPVIVGIQGVLLIGFVAVHASQSYGWAGLLAFLALCSGTGFALEAISIQTGFPFGFFEHGTAFGPKLLGVPAPVAIGYAMLGYLAWSLARVITRSPTATLSRSAMVATPIVGTFVLAGYDLAYDPIGSTALGFWTYRAPSGQFGVPLTNFFGWLVTGWTMFQLFALIEARFRPTGIVASRGYWSMPCIIWGVTVLQYPAMLARAPAGMVTRGGRSFVVADIYEASLITALLTMGLATVAALARLAAAPRERQSVSPGPPS